jgi:CheY-like chemotaxis protein
MILLVTPSERSRECSAALQEATGEEVMVAESLARATTLLRAECYQVVVLDQYLLEIEPHEAGSTLEHMGTAIPVQVNLAISGMERLLREVRSAIQRRQFEEVRARRAVIGTIYSELNGTVTALLLSTELALEAPGLPVAASEKLESVHDLVKKLRKQLESGATAQVEEAKRTAGV